MSEQNTSPSADDHEAREAKLEERRLDLEVERLHANEHRVRVLSVALLAAVCLWRLPNFGDAVQNDNTKSATTTSAQNPLTADQAGTVVEILETVARAPQGSRESIPGSLLGVLGSDLPSEVKTDLQDLVQTGGETFAHIVEAFRSGSGSSTAPATQQPISVEVHVVGGCKRRASSTSDGSHPCEVQCKGSTGGSDSDPWAHCARSWILGDP